MTDCGFLYLGPLNRCDHSTEQLRSPFQTVFIIRRLRLCQFYIGFLQNIIVTISNRIIINNVNDRPVISLNGVNYTDVVFKEGTDSFRLAAGVVIFDEDIEDSITRSDMH